MKVQGSDNEMGKRIPGLFGTVLLLIGGIGAEAGELRKVSKHSFTVPAPVAEVFPLFDPIGESRWAPEWAPVPVYPAEITPLEKAVFLTGSGDRQAIWTILRFEPEKYRVEYLNTVPGFQQRWITVQCTGLTARETRVKVQYDVTALSEEGLQEIDRYNAETLAQWEAPVRGAISNDKTME